MIERKQWLSCCRWAPHSEGASQKGYDEVETVNVSHLIVARKAFALMTDLLAINVDDSVLEIGTGLGYQAAILTQLARRVYSVEIIEELGREAKRRSVG
jgi:protein-L-isoaspartate O-methyltransferase